MSIVTSSHANKVVARPIDEVQRRVEDRIAADSPQKLREQAPKLGARISCRHYSN